MLNPHIKFEMSTITCNEEMKGNAKCKNFRFEPPLGDLGVTYTVHLWLAGKRVVDFQNFMNSVRNVLLVSGQVVTRSSHTKSTRTRPSQLIPERQVKSYPGMQANSYPAIHMTTALSKITFYGLKRF